MGVGGGVSDESAYVWVSTYYHSINKQKYIHSSVFQPASVHAIPLLHPPPYSSCRSFVRITFNLRRPMIVTLTLETVGC